MTRYTTNARICKYCLPNHSYKAGSMHDDKLFLNKCFLGTKMRGLEILQPGVLFFLAVLVATFHAGKSYRVNASGRVTCKMRDASLSLWLELRLNY